MTWSHLTAVTARRGAGLPLALGILVLGAIELSGDPDTARSSWLGLALTLRESLVILMPLAVGAGAWQGARARLRGVDELEGCAPRPRALIAAVQFGALAAPAVAAYVLLHAGAAVALRDAGSLAASAPAAAAIGALSLVAAVLVGLALGRLMPSRLTAPVLIVVLAGVLFVLGTYEAGGSMVALLGPAIQLAPGADAIRADVTVSQVLWFTALAAGAAVLLVARSLIARASAVALVAAAAVAALALLPSAGATAFERAGDPPASLAQR